MYKMYAYNELSPTYKTQVGIVRSVVPAKSVVIAIGYVVVLSGLFPLFKVFVMCKRIPFTEVSVLVYESK